MHGDYTHFDVQVLLVPNSWPTLFFFNKIDCMSVWPYFLRVDAGCLYSMHPNYQTPEVYLGLILHNFTSVPISQFGALNAHSDNALCIKIKSIWKITVNKACTSNYYPATIGLKHLNTKA